MTTNLLLDISSTGVATLSLNRPEKHNAFDDVLIEELITSLEKLKNDSQVHVVILTAQGKSFSAGADLSWMQRMVNYTHEENLRDARRLAELMRILNSLSKPTLALVQGAAIGGGVGLVACCDIVMATPQASFCFSEVKLGLIPAVISPYVINAMGERSARRYFLTAERFSAETALTLGLISEVVPEAELSNRANVITEHLLNNSSAALSASKKLIARVNHREVNAELIEETAQFIADIRVSKDAQQRLSRFLAKK